jgi:hypothetical protein
MEVLLNDGNLFFNPRLGSGYAEAVIRKYVWQSLDCESILQK